MASETAKHDDSNDGGKAECMTNDRQCTGWRQCSLIIYVVAEARALSKSIKHPTMAVVNADVHAV